METVKQMIFTNWHFMRWLRLILGGFIAAQAIQNHDLIPVKAIQWNVEGGVIVSALVFAFRAYVNNGGAVFQLAFVIRFWCQTQ